MYPTYPDSPEAVALKLWERIIEREEPAGRNEPPAARMIALYAECLAAVQGRCEMPTVLH